MLTKYNREANFSAWQSDHADIVTNKSHLYEKRVRIITTTFTIRQSSSLFLWNPLSLKNVLEILEKRNNPP